MPKQNLGRRRREERWLAQRIEWEQSKRRWTNAQLADAMGRVGCGLDQSAIHKIYRGTPQPRAIRVEELAAFAEVFDLPVQELLKPVWRVQSEQLDALVGALNEQQGRLYTEARAIADTVLEIAALSQEAGEFHSRLLTALAKQEAAVRDLIDLSFEAQDALLGVGEG